MIITVIILTVNYADIEDIYISDDELKNIKNFIELQNFLEYNYYYPINDQNWEINNICLKDYDLESEHFLNYLVNENRNNNRMINLNIIENKYDIYIKFKDSLYKIEDISSQVEFSEIYIIFTMVYNISIESYNFYYEDKIIDINYNLAYYSIGNYSVIELK